MKVSNEYSVCLLEARKLHANNNTAVLEDSSTGLDYFDKVEVEACGRDVKGEPFCVYQFE